MIPNPLLKKLGFSSDDRVIIIHADDLGMCQATITACETLFQVSGISSAAVMVPCPWFLSAAELPTKNSYIDLGVHLTLTSEWKKYRWRPLSTVDRDSGLIDQEGFFYSKSSDVHLNAKPEFVREEIKQQIDSAIKAGIQPTHIDTHMGSVAHPKFMFDYINAGLMRKIPLMVFRMNKNDWMKMGLDEESATIVEKFINHLEEQGVPILDHLRSIPLDLPENRFEQATEIFSALPIGITHFIIHPAEDTPELRTITPDWKSRVGDFNLFRDKRIHDYINNQGIQVIGYKDILSVFPSSDIILS
ncbi:MAG: polysaccharide deacetylase family protein [Anaerolineaceae bacterium]|nr:polysaccharide deacetylase family protein [Anaerolineaceae bacterium]